MIVLLVYLKCDLGCLVGSISSEYCQGLNVPHYFGGY